MVLDCLTWLTELDWLCIHWKELWCSNFNLLPVADALWAQLLPQMLSEMGWSRQALVRKMPAPNTLKDGEPAKNQFSTRCCNSNGKDCKVGHQGWPSESLPLCAEPEQT